MALQQCLHYLDHFDWKLVEAEDTAGSAKGIFTSITANIWLRLQAGGPQVYGLDLIAPAIQTVKNNYTRFIILQPEDKARIAPMPIRLPLIFIPTTQEARWLKY